MSARVEGFCDSRFEHLRDAFAALFEADDERGAALCVVVDGRPVVDLFAGHADEARTRPWQRDTLVNVFSTTKGMTSLCAHRLIDAGRLDPEARVSRYWPEFAEAGKEDVRVRNLLDHSVGLPALRDPLNPESVYDWNTMTRLLAAEAPFWEPGTEHGYHPFTFGWLVGELIRRVDGRTPGRFFREEIAGPLGADVQIGLDERDDARCADVLPTVSMPPDMLKAITERVTSPESVVARAYLNPFIPPQNFNSRAWRAAEIPAANGHATARGLATVYGAAACGERTTIPVLTDAGVERARTELRNGPDRMSMGLTVRFSLGFMLGTPDEPFGAAARPFGHPGAGGSLAFADPDARLGFAYVMNRMRMALSLVGPRAIDLARTTYECL